MVPNDYEEGFAIAVTFDYMDKLVQASQVWITCLGRRTQSFVSDETCYSPVLRIRLRSEEEYKEAHVVLGRSLGHVEARQSELSIANPLQLWWR